MTTMNRFFAMLRGSRAILRRCSAAALCLQLVWGSALPAWAQRRRAEPEANPEFQQQVQSPSEGQGGGPIEAPAAEPEAAPEAAEQASFSGTDESVESPRSVQIGTGKSAKSREAATASLLDTRVNVRVKGAPLPTFLEAISSQAKINFIITEGLETRRVTAFLQNVTVREALQVLLEMKGLTYQQVGKSNTYIINPRSKTVVNLITRIYTLNYIPLIELGSSASEAAVITPGGGGGAGAAGGAASSAGGMPGSPSPSGMGGGGSVSGGGGVAIINVLKSILTKDNGQVAIEPRTNALIVTDVPEVFPQVEQIIAELDKKAPQVMIEAQIVEIDSTRSRDLGFEWGGANGELASFTAGARDTSFPMQLPSDLSRTRFLDPVGGVVSTLGGAAGGSSASPNPSLFQSNLKTSVLDLTSLKITLRALVSRSEARFLGKPKILTLNNKSAIIQIANSQAVSVQNQQSSAGGALATQTQSVERVETGLILRVTPQINKEGYITLLVQPSFTDVHASAISVNGVPVFDPVSRGASTLVRIKNGQTMVLGGLLESTESKTIRKVPFLGYIPLVGWLFTSTQTSRKNTDLVIFITPTIVND